MKGTVLAVVFTVVMPVVSFSLNTRRHPP